MKLINLTHQLFSFLSFLRPILGPRGCCKFEINCLNFAKIQLKNNNPFKALFNIFKRLISCI